MVFSSNPATILPPIYKDEFSVWCVKHDYTPTSSTKMSGKPQAAYPKKNWSSFMVFNCEHEDCKQLYLKVNDESPSYLHRFEWTKEERIYELNKTWNFLVGEYEIDSIPYLNKNDNLPFNLHYTLGSPIHDINCKYGQVWFDTLNDLLGREKTELNIVNLHRTMLVWSVFFE